MKTKIQQEEDTLNIILFIIIISLFITIVILNIFLWKSYFELKDIEKEIEGIIEDNKVILRDLENQGYSFLDLICTTGNLKEIKGVVE